MRWKIWEADVPVEQHTQAQTLALALDAARADGERVAFVPTMGALHAGHLTLVRAAFDQAPNVVVSIFVNPTQFDRAEDLAAYPRDVGADLAALGRLLEEVGSDRATCRLLAYVPPVADVYPDGPVRTLQVGGVGDHLCGATRPGHFDGVATVVDALLRRVQPDVLLLGRKDHQQLQVVREMVMLQAHPVQVIGVPTVREDDGLARSSRNRLLSVVGRQVARRIPVALAAAVTAARASRAAQGSVDATVLRDTLRRSLERHRDDGAGRSGDVGGDGPDVVYAEIVDPVTVAPWTGPIPVGQEVLAAVAVFVPGLEGPIRLIDNVCIGDPADEERLLRCLGEGSGR